MAGRKSRDEVPQHMDPGLCEEFNVDSRDETPHTESQNVGRNTQHDLKTQLE